MYSLSRCLYLLQSLLITLFGDKNSCLEIRVMCCFSKLVEEGVGRHGFAALFTSPRRSASLAALPVSHPGCWDSPCQLGPPKWSASHPLVWGGWGHPGTAAPRRSGRLGGYPSCAQQLRCPAQPGRSPHILPGSTAGTPHFCSVTRLWGTRHSDKVAHRLPTFRLSQGGVSGSAALLHGSIC